MTNALATLPPGTRIPTNVPGVLDMATNPWTRIQIDLFKQEHAVGASDAEVAYFQEVCHQIELNPFLGHIHYVPRRQKNDAGEWARVFKPQIGIDGYRVLALRTGRYHGGKRGPEWWQPPRDEKTGEGFWRGEWPWDNRPPIACKVGVLADGVPDAVWATVYWSEMYQRDRDGQPVAMWRQMPRQMLEKCAESKALRTAFADHLVGVVRRLGLDPDSALALPVHEPEPGGGAAPAGMNGSASVVETDGLSGDDDVLIADDDPAWDADSFWRAAHELGYRNDREVAQALQIPMSFAEWRERGNDWADAIAALRDIGPRAVVKPAGAEVSAAAQAGYARASAGRRR